MATCPGCGEASSGDSPFCAACGTRLDPPAGGAAPAPDPGNPFAQFAQFDDPGAAEAFGPPAVPPTGPPGPALVVPTTTTSLGRNVVIGIVLVLVLAAAAFAVLGSGGDDGGSGGVADDATTTTLLGLATTPELSDEEFLIDTIAAAEGSGPLAEDDEDECFYRSMIAAMGGATALRGLGIRPEELAGTFPLRGQVIPADATETFLATNASCGLDLTEVFFVRPVNLELGDAPAACVDASIDRVSLNRLIAEFFLDPNRSDFTFVPPGDVIERTQALVDACV